MLQECHESQWQTIHKRMLTKTCRGNAASLRPRGSQMYVSEKEVRYRNVSDGAGTILRALYLTNTVDLVAEFNVNALAAWNV